MIYAILGLVGMFKLVHMPHVLQELGGWQSVEMVKVYAHLAVQHLAVYVDSS